MIRSFEKCGISIPIDGSKDDKINIGNIDNYTVASEDEDKEATDASDEDKDPFSTFQHLPACTCTSNFC